MRRRISRRILRRKALAGLLAVAAVAATASLAAAQAGPAPDGGPAPGGGAVPPPKVTNCGPLQTSTVLTQNVPRTTNVAGFQTVPGASVPFTVPAGQSRCVKLLFTAETACGLTAGPDLCYVRALIDNAPMDPDGANFQAIDSEDGSAGAHAYEWVKRVGPGAHVVSLQARVLAAGTPFWLDDWTFDFQLHL
jgi:hypothetical protein